MRQRTKLTINVGNLLELTGAICGVWAVDRLAGFSWALVLAAVLLVAGAELVYGEHPDPMAPPGTPRVWKIPLPLRPQPSRWATERRQAIEVWRAQRVALKATGRQRALDRAAAADPETRG
jgi:hypothetical protein